MEEDTLDNDPRAALLWYNSSTSVNQASLSSWFSFTISGHDSLKSWYLNRVAQMSSLSLVGLSLYMARSYYFASPASQSTPVKTPQSTPRKLWPSFLQSPKSALFSLRKDGQHGGGKGEKGKEAFMAYLRLYRRPYDEMVYRAKMKPSLGGLVSIMSPYAVVDATPARDYVSPAEILRVFTVDATIERKAIIKSPTKKIPLELVMREQRRELKKKRSSEGRR
ncbi:hypothetical protein J5N97_022305 [Dioscorea zingiberensis]|uniref:Uncharacterized protein n=1 Tax=Dioscorea zingiberensis TaxID=325984 RepID=A0A9D5CAY1_9LILI|nr:hypothetical protein J5N97_022305 [Dioscorea zingiberensis]